jgi:transcriptional regulator with XRE-family HTH domain
MKKEEKVLQENLRLLYKSSIFNNQEAFAKYFGATRGMFESYLRGSAEPPLYFLSEVCNTFSITMEDVLHKTLIKTDIFCKLKKLPNSKLLRNLIEEEDMIISDAIDRLKEKSEYSEDEISNFFKTEDVIPASVFQNIGYVLDLPLIEKLNELAGLDRKGKIIQFYELDEEMKNNINKMIDEKIEKLIIPFKKEIAKKTPNKSVDKPAK